MLFSLLFLSLVPVAFMSDGLLSSADAPDDGEGNGLGNDEPPVGDNGDFIAGSGGSTDDTADGDVLLPDDGMGDGSSPHREETLLDQLLGSETDAHYGREDMPYFVTDTDVVTGTDAGDELAFEDDGVDGTGSGDADLFHGTARLANDDGSAVDLLSGGDGDDVLTGGDDAGYLFGGGGDDRITTGEGASAAYGGEGTDNLDGSESIESILDGGHGDDTLLGGDGDDILRGGAHELTEPGQTAPQDDDVLDGGAGDDHLAGGLGADTLFGGDGDDVIDHLGHALEESSQELRSFDWHIDGDADTLDGGAGNDTLIMDRADTATGGEGNDTFWLYSDAEQGIGSAEVTDFVPGEDFLRISLDPELDEEGMVYDVQPSGDGSDGVVTVNGDVVAILRGAPGATIHDVYVEVTQDITV